MTYTDKTLIVHSLSISCFVNMVCLNSDDRLDSVKEKLRGVEYRYTFKASISSRFVHTYCKNFVIIVKYGEILVFKAIDKDLKLYTILRRYCENFGLYYKHNCSH